MATRTVPPFPNGKIPKNQLSPIPGGQLWTPAANAWNDLVEFVRRQEGDAAADALRAGGPDSSYRLYGRQVYFKNLWTSRGKPQMAADPGTSNHGLGIAVDCPSTLGKKMLRKYGHLFGWSNYEGARIGEDWHWTYCGSAHYKRRYHKDPFYFGADDERRWYAEWQDLLRKKKNLPRRIVLKRTLVKRRKVLYDLIKNDTAENNRRYNRRARCNFIHKVTT
jgi:hypothetical protein